MLHVNENQLRVVVVDVVVVVVVIVVVVADLDNKKRFALPVKNYDNNHLADHHKGMSLPDSNESRKTVFCSRKNCIN